MLRSSLQAKILVLVFILLSLGFGATAVISIDTERDLLISQTTERASILASTIHKSIRNNMLEGRPDIARSLLNELKRQEGVKALQVFRLDGSEAFTDMRTLRRVTARNIPLGKNVIKSIRDRAMKLKEPMDSLKGNPHFQRAIDTGKDLYWMHNMTVGKNKTVRALTFLKPFENETACQVCHGSENKVRGIVRISTDISELDKKTAALRNRQIAIAVGTLLVVGFVLVFFLRKTVVRPIVELADCATRVGQGDFEALPVISGEDEIARLCQSFRGMAASLSSAYTDLQNKNAELENTLEELRESRQRVEMLETLKGQLSKFIPESVKKLLEENPDADTLEKKEKDVTVLFIDLEGYTKMTETFPQDVVNQVVERYFSSFLDIVSEFKGDINETAGDGLMVIFQDDEDPLAHSANAVEAAIKMRARAMEINANRPKGYPSVLANFGINSGTASVGATKFETAGGSARWTFTASGSVTIHAARIGALATKGRIFIGPETSRRVGERYALVDMGEHQLKNVQNPMQIFQVIPTGTIFPAGTMDPVKALERETEGEERTS